MVARKVIGILLSLCLFAFHPGAYAETPATETAQSGPRQQLATIIFAGLAGAVMGLSTLSFYGRPQDRLSNIAVGFAIGVISGAVYTTYKTATQPYGSEEAMSALDEVRIANLKFDDREMQDFSQSTQFSFSWNF